MQRVKRSHEKLHATVAAFEEASGIKLNKWSSDGMRIGAAVDVVLMMQGRFGAIRSLANTAKALGRDAERMQGHIESLVSAAQAAGIQGEFPLDDAE